MSVRLIVPPTVDPFFFSYKKIICAYLCSTIVLPLTTQIIYMVTKLIFIMFSILSEGKINPGIYLHSRHEWLRLANCLLDD